MYIEIYSRSNSDFPGITIKGEKDDKPEDIAKTYKEIEKILWENITQTPEE